MTNFPNQDFPPNPHPYNSGLPGNSGYDPYQHSHLDQGPQSSAIGTMLAWLVIIAVTGFLFFMTVSMQLQGPQESGDTSAAELMQVNVQAKVLTGMKSMTGMLEEAAKQPNNKDGDNKNVNTPQPLGDLNIGPPEQRWASAILLNEISGPEAAIKQMRKTDEVIERNDYPLTDRQKRLRQITDKLLEQYSDGDYDSDSIATDDQAFVKKEFGFVGQLLLYPPKTNHTDKRASLENDAFISTTIAITAFLAGMLMVVIGLIILLVLFVKVANGSIFSQFGLTSYGGIYAETFAIWILGFVGLQFGLSFAVEYELLPTSIITVITPIIFFGSLSVLVWPVLRGVSFSQMKEDIGWKLKNPLVEGGVAGISYVGLLPVLAVSIFAAVMIMIMMANAMPASGELASQGGVGHPIQEQIASGDTVAWIMIFITACVAAPVVEETMFRGVLYRHLRDATGRSNRLISVLFAALLNGLVFALIHPQGLFGVPMLTTLAIGFSLVREWRGSIFGPMVMHAIHNSVLTCMMFVLM